MLGYRVCPHCSKTVSTKVYKDHKRLYYSKSENTWIVSTLLTCTAVSSDEEADLPSPPPSVFEGMYENTMSIMVNTCCVFQHRSLPSCFIACFSLFVTDSHKSAGEECESCEPEYDKDMAEFAHPDHEAMEEGTFSDEDDDQQS